MYEPTINSSRKKLLRRWRAMLGSTVIPIKLFLSEKGWLKALIACAIGKKLHDKREDLKLKDDQRDMDRALKR